MVLQPETGQCVVPARPMLHAKKAADGGVCFSQADSVALIQYVVAMDKALRACRVRYDGLRRKYNLVIKALK